uniref:Uncharacterized protein n=1 Tax=Pelagomonas calceolata TaxID=35677 RepID=A0A7S3ZZ10_9STRA
MWRRRRRHGGLDQCRRPGVFDADGLARAVCTRPRLVVRDGGGECCESVARPLLRLVGSGARREGSSISAKPPPSFASPVRLRAAVLPAGVDALVMWALRLVSCHR